MPTITPQVRPSIGGIPAHSSGEIAHQAASQPKPVVQASTRVGNYNVTKAISGQVNTPEETAQTAAEGTPDKLRLSPQLSALARKEQKFEQERQSFLAEKARWEADRADYVSKKQFKEKFGQDATEALKDLGTDYTELTNLLLNQTEVNDPVRELKSEVESLKSAQKQAETKQEQAVLGQYRSEVTSLVSRDPEFITIKEKGKEATEMVVQYIKQTFETEGTQLTVDEACRDIEAYFVEEASKALQLTKIKAQMKPTSPEEKPQKKTLPPPTTTGQGKTLTQNMGSSSQSIERTPNQFQYLSMKERLAQAIARAQR